MVQPDDARLSIALAEVLAEGATKKLFSAVLRTALQELIDEELIAAIGAGPHERTDTRTNQRNVDRPTVVSIPAGDVELRRPSSAVMMLHRREG